MTVVGLSARQPHNGRSVRSEVCLGCRPSRELLVLATVQLLRMKRIHSAIDHLCNNQSVLGVGVARRWFNDSMRARRSRCCLPMGGA